MEKENSTIDLQEKESDRALALDDDNEERKLVKQVTSAQDVLVKKVLKSSKIKDAEYRLLKGIYDNQVTTSYDASVFIEYLLAIVKFRRMFLNGKHKAYKKCYYCNDRNQVERYLNMSNGKKAWVCSFCAINLDPSKFVPVKISEENDVKCDLWRKNLHNGLTSAQEDLICEHRER